MVSEGESGTERVYHEEDSGFVEAEGLGLGDARCVSLPLDPRPVHSAQALTALPVRRPPAQLHLGEASPRAASATAQPQRRRCPSAAPRPPLAAHHHRARRRRAQRSGQHRHDGPRPGRKGRRAGAPRRSQQAQSRLGAAGSAGAAARVGGTSGRGRGRGGDARCSCGHRRQQQRGGPAQARDGAAPRAETPAGAAESVELCWRRGGRGRWGAGEGAAAAAAAGEIRGAAAELGGGGGNCARCDGCGWCWRRRRWCFGWARGSGSGRRPGGPRRGEQPRRSQSRADEERLVRGRGRGALTGRVRQRKGGQARRRRGVSRFALSARCSAAAGSFPQSL